MSQLIGRPVARVEARAKVTGAARYAADAQVAGAAHGFLALSTVARGVITGIDVRAARAVPGVLAVLTHETMPRLRAPDASTGYFKGFVPLQDDVIHHAGQPVALVVAETLEQAKEAAGLVRATYDAEPPRVVMADAMDEAYVPPPGFDGPNDLTRGDVDEGWAEAEASVDVTCTTVMQHHNAMEPSVTLAAWDGDRLTVHESTQGVTGTQQSLAHAFDVPTADVRVISPYVGGAFGAKTTWPHALLTAAAARHVGRPVKLVLSRAQSYTSHGHRPETHQRVRLGARRDGRLTVAEHVTTEQMSRTEEAVYSPNAGTRVHYAIPHLRSVQRLVRLDLPTGIFARSPETTTLHALECALDELSLAVGMDPVELRLRNAATEHPETGEPVNWHQARCLNRGAELFGWADRDPTPRSMRDGGLLVGWGVASASHVAGGIPGGGGARATLSADGTALVQCGTQDIGTGTYTALSQVSADRLGMPLTSIRFELGDSDLPSAPVSAGSATLQATVPSVAAACGAARDTVVRLAVDDPESPLHGRDPERIATAEGHLFVRDDPERRDSYAAVVGRHGSPVVVHGQPGNTTALRSTGAVFVEVTVHPRLGTVRVRRVVGVFDAGRILNHRTTRSQAIGGIIWSIGIALTEHTLVDAASGRVVTPNLSGYLVPVNADVPDMVVEFVDEPDPASPALGARGFGETPSTGASAAIANAVHHATGRRVRDLPLGLDRLL
ncbi:xanthine dehydrogenase family protein molybdopterin-binding subunit [Streptomyces radicis]|uniref:Xanthine dehydrogenase family protein molybdopterin-binding subunit n=1 Tax=Streptomyces radicis TaxID=1750517 RepID=A0A3A9VTM7_9ACTN|nr:xanthine dehydrogenase family protein molybdopterin-binding subunit [Streptomyces radicis]RKN04238.1 xanthine dehydrogenase family protein molybdopterin-binding subunit [Streptomyces radicis]RKN14756.1 xanthine dehydrogenase family protein molybdopterin-binding subunit [Streptomyces radicis]